MKIDLEDVLDAIAVATDVATGLNGTELPAKGGGNSGEVAAANRALLELADQLGLASALAREEYWKGRRA